MFPPSYETGNKGGRMRDVSDDFGGQLRSRRQAAGLSLRELSGRIHYSPGHLSKVENNQVAPSPQLVRLSDAALNAKGQLIALLASCVASDPEPHYDAEETWMAVMDPGWGSWFAWVHGGRSLIAADALPLGSGTGPLSAVRPAQTDVIVKAFLGSFDRIRAWCRAMDARILLPVLWAQTHALRELARAAPAASRPTVYVLAARHAELTGWMAQESGDDRAALWWTDEAVRLAEAGGDRTMGAYAYIRRAMVALYHGDAIQTVKLARHASRHAHISTSLKGLAALREAQGLALVGDAAACRSSLDRARGYLAEPDTAQATLSALGMTTLADHVAMTAAWCLYDLGEPARSAAMLGAEVARIPATARRARTRFSVRQALAYAAAGEIDHACALARRLLPDIQDVGSATIRHDLRQLTRTLRRWPSHGPVREIQPDLDRLLRVPLSVTPS
jgi:Helix-turn-helix domain